MRKALVFLRKTAKLALVYICFKRMRMLFNRHPPFLLEPVHSVLPITHIFWKDAEGKLAQNVTQLKPALSLW